LKFIVLEGLDGSGKTTQLHRLAKHFIDPFVTKEPAEGFIGRAIREVLTGRARVGSEALAMLFAADRLCHLETEVRPALAAGKVVLCDRFLYSNLAYQPEAARFNETVLREGPLPDITLFIDTPPEECTKRIAARGSDREIFDGTERATHIRAAYLQAFRRFGELMPVAHIDGNQEEGKVFQNILDALREIL